MLLKLDDSMYINSNRDILIILLYIIKPKFKKIKKLNIKPNILNLIDEKVGNNLWLIGTRKVFLNKTSIAQRLKSTINKWAFMKLKCFYRAKELSFGQSSRLADYRMGKDVYQPHMWEKANIQNIYKILKTLIIKTTSNSIKTVV